MAGDGKRKRAPTPPSESFGVSEYSEEQYSDSDGESRPPLRSPTIDSDDSLGLTPGERAYIRVVEHPGLADTDESDESEEEEDSEEDDGKGSDSGGGSSKGSNSGASKGGKAKGGSKGGGGDRSTGGKAAPA